jgi:hypothetical protein
MADSDLEHHADALWAIGGSAVALLNAAMILAIVAVLLSAQSQTAAVIKSALDFMAWLVEQVIKPIQPGASVALTPGLALAGGYATGTYPGLVDNGTFGTGTTGTATGTTTGTATGTTTGTTTGTATLPAGWSSTYVAGYTYAGATLSDGSMVYGYQPPHA